MNMTPKNPRWNNFLEMLNASVNSNGCNTKDSSLAQEIVNNSFPECDLEGSVVNWRQFGGFCDCEILMNVESSFDPKKEIHCGGW